MWHGEGNFKLCLDKKISNWEIIRVKCITLLVNQVKSHKNACGVGIVVFSTTKHLTTLWLGE